MTLTLENIIFSTFDHWTVAPGGVMQRKVTLDPWGSVCRSGSIRTGVAGQDGDGADGDEGTMVTTASDWIETPLLFVAIQM